MKRILLVAAIVALMTPAFAWPAPAPVIPAEAREELVALARKVLSGEVKEVPTAELLKMHASLRQPVPEQLFVTIFRDRAPGIRFTAQKLGLAEATFAAMGRARMLPSFEFYHYDDAKNVTLLFERVSERRTIAPARWLADLSFMELGVDGLAITNAAFTGVDKLGKPAVYPAREGALPPGEVFVSGLSSRDEFINRLSSSLRVYFKLPRISAPDMTTWDPARTRVELLGFETFLSRGAGYPVVALHRLNDLSVAPWKDRVAEARQLADAMMRRQLSDGRFFTRFEARYGRFTWLQGNAVDQAAACLTLCDVAAVSGEPGRERCLAAAGRGIEHLKTLFRQQKTLAGDPFLFVVQNDEAGLGAAAVAVLALDRYASLTGSVFQDGDMKLLGKFLLTQQDDDGSFRHYFRFDPKVAFRYRLTHSFPGQAAWALAVLDKRFGGAEYGKAARKGADYLVTKREEEMHWAEAPSDPWLASALRELSTPVTEVPAYASYARRMAEQTATRQKIAGSPDMIGSFTGESEEGSVGAAALSMRLMGEAAAFAAVAPEARAALVDAMRRSERFLQINEMRPNNAFYLPAPERAYGFIRNGTFDPDVRLDTTCYVIEALLWLDRVEKLK